MATTIKFNYKDKDYCLEFTRNTVRAMQKNGFVLGDVSEVGMVVLPDLFSGAFMAHHPTVKQSTVEDIFAHMTNKRELLVLLAQMYNEPMEAYLDEPEEGEGLNWTAN